MKAIIVREFGGPDVLCLEKIPPLIPSAGEVLIRVRAVTVNRTGDHLIAMGAPHFSGLLPIVPGMNPAGEMALVGSGVNVFNSGDRVVVFSRIPCGQCRDCTGGDEGNCGASSHIGIDRWGGYAEYIVAPAVNVFPLPAKLSFVKAAAVMHQYPTALHLLVNKAHLKPGQWVLVMGASGGLGTCGVRVAVAMGARVIAGAGADNRVDLALLMGAEAGINYRTKDLTAEVMRITNGVGVDVVYENISDPSTWPAAFASLCHGGVLVTAGAHGGGKVTLNTELLLHRRNRILGAAGASIENVLTALDGAGTGKYRVEIEDIIPLEDLHAGAHQPRHEFDKKRLQELARSIEQSGVLQPIIVRQGGIGYEIVAGERRTRAARIAGLAEIPAVVRRYTDEQVLILSLVENVQRADLNPIDKARAYQRLTGRLGVTQEEVAKRIGLDRSSVANLIRLLELPEEIQELVQSGAMAMGHARALLPLDDDVSQLGLAERIVRDGLSVRAVEDLVRKSREGGAVPVRRSNPRKTPEIRALEDELRGLLGTKVSIQDQRGKGKIVIEYYTPDDFAGVLERIRRTRGGFSRPLD